MSAIRLYLLEVEKDKAGATHIAKQTSDRMDVIKQYSGPVLTFLAGLVTKDLKLFELIESLGEFLNNEDPSIRQRGGQLPSSAASIN
jgi:DNA repair/transcription protein MET18/MMS19